MEEPRGGIIARPTKLCRPGCLVGSVLWLAAAACSDGPPADEAWPSAGRVPADVEAAAATITAASVGTHVGVLAADSMRGRATPSPGLALSAAYIADQFGRAGLAGAFAGSHLETFPCTGVPETQWPANVAAVMRGSDSRLAGEWVVVSAHYDHIGTRDTVGPDSIMNGADDNASGTAVVLEVARALSRLATPPARSIAFLTPAGEELGLVGASWFVGHAIPGATIVADINVDMAGRNDPGVLYVSGDTLSTLGDNARQLAGHYPDLGLRLFPEMINAFRRSDQFPFALAGVPALMLTAGLDPRYYHRVNDQVESLNLDKIARIARLTLYMAYDVASRRKRPVWTAAGTAARASFQPWNATCAPVLRN